VTLPGPADRRTRALLNRPATVVDGYLDVMGDARVPQTTGQRVMGSTVLRPPVLFWGFTARNTAQQDQRRLLDDRGRQLADHAGAGRARDHARQPGRRIAVLTTCARGPAPVRRAEVAASRLAPLRLFDVTRNVSAASQTVAGRKVDTAT